MLKKVLLGLFARAMLNTFICCENSRSHVRSRLGSYSSYYRNGLGEQ
jgi:hypothetical protein